VIIDIAIIIDSIVFLQKFKIPKRQLLSLAHMINISFRIALPTYIYTPIDFF